MIPIPPEETQALRTVLSSSGPKVAAALGCPEETVDQFLRAAKIFVETMGISSSAPAFALSLQLGSTANPSLTTGMLRRYLKEGKRVLLVSANLALIGTSSDSILLSAISSRTAQNGSFEVLVQGTYFYSVLGGRIIDEGQIRTINSSARPSNQWLRPFSEINELLRDHVDNYIAREQGTRYWENKMNRILLKGSDGTESIFQLALYWWLKNYVADSIDVYAEPTSHGQDKTDVVIVTMEGKFVIEVKWLGKNESGTTYTETRIQEGLEQVAIYLVNDTRIVGAYLVIYDARSSDQHLQPRSYEPTCRHLRCSEPRLIYLESDTPTQAVKKRQRTKKRKA